VSEPTPQVNEEFFIRVNDLIEAANRIERRYDSEHAELVMLHAFARYSAHHYLLRVQGDSFEQRDAYAIHVANSLGKLVMGNLEQMSGLAPGSEAAAAPSGE
jgi:hypothetical protein